MSAMLSSDATFSMEMFPFGHCPEGGSGDSGGNRLSISMVVDAWLSKNEEARILELKRRNMKKTDSDILYAVSIKEDTAYLWLRFVEDHEGTRSNTSYLVNSIRRIQDIEGEYYGIYQTWSLLQEIPNIPYPYRPIRRID
ncbi:hypothetical protein Tco_1489609 [Tanacetum coccineum]